MLTKLVAPTPRAALITGKAFAAGVRSLMQVISKINPLSYKVEEQEKIGGGAAAKPDADGGTACLDVHRADGGTARRGAAA